ncbi:LOW QUALITY PROTEIN: uncharacterized protein LOC18013840 [Eutrema salsugineum]|uniref:LOW QUALITY PROTEIN: uncharacterized protein LOC18013840 n=1 Tax=Eutrema salsugineum TaxID=72664 RepID=UPI000CED3AF7|nr:LOW QUALITY PROTEIN: uncharacterized protein LOC18013840 [Eutrema salsugineum]
MGTSSIKLPIHEHPLISTSRFLGSCDGCSTNHGGCYYGGYRCNVSDCEGAFFHKECAESPLEINHPSHRSDHPLRLTKNPPRSICDLCGNNIFVDVTYLYHCSKCDFNVDTSCARKPPLPLVVELNLQELPFFLLKETESEDSCGVCKQRVSGTYHFGRPSCDEYVHVECINVKMKVNLPFHPSHPLEFIIISESLSDDAEKACVLCGVRPEFVLYYCSICGFSICLDCVKIPPPLVIKHSKTHEHHLTLLSRRISFTCNVCGMHEDEGSCYLCLPCGFMVHRSCIDLPQVIIINRHDHRISRTNHLGPGYSNCGVCRLPLNQFYGLILAPFVPNMLFIHNAQQATKYGMG